ALNRAFSARERCPVWERARSERSEPTSTLPHPISRRQTVSGAESDRSGRMITIAPSLPVIDSGTENGAGRTLPEAIIRAGRAGRKNQYPRTHFMTDLLSRILPAVTAKSYTPIKAKALFKRLNLGEEHYPEFRKTIRELTKSGRLAL